MAEATIQPARVRRHATIPAESVQIFDAAVSAQVEPAADGYSPEHGPATTARVSVSSAAEHALAVRFYRRNRTVSDWLHVAPGEVREWHIPRATQSHASRPAATAGPWSA
jgi:hypothetical protein